MFQQLLLRIGGVDERDAVALEQDLADPPPRPLPEVQLGRLVHD